MHGSISIRVGPLGVRAALLGWDVPWTHQVEELWVQELTMRARKNTPHQTTSNNAVLGEDGRERAYVPHIRVCQWLHARGEEQSLPTTTARGRVVTSAE